MDSVQCKALGGKKNNHSESGRKVSFREIGYFEKVIFHCYTGYKLSINFCQLGSVSQPPQSCLLKA